MEAEFLSTEKVLDILTRVAKGQAADVGVTHPEDIAAQMGAALFASADTLMVLRDIGLVRWEQ